ncbi:MULTISPECIES: Crp/Fnr family transcriptional regulator [Vibrio]|jgi:CRP-like cAMP-binding protein|uniref:Crp/Fnr family transcriptional regulator n=1 Tax=Vibrio TaxID=662 RepID=UPI0002376B93|nr:MULTISPECIES: Crp/Fnr family transcriptional regulator [Vibrio]MDK9776005.1 Crp/Fnr family transcriptional regulator [Vibrio sp. D401a]MDK9805971.1 Crp/Fnr family transcriptional regulator [Vibrio sp. D406a]NOH68333.1 Crp/Fnr family transcriptional regulator [Vibrio rotiferianus]TMX31275.1 Crp/Fnr family transcriptional regulator [Vibrio rotiferianus]TMX43125.1 Crp/Fnr family transcriptional regulator [Vibrio rotiferianus]
MRISPYSTGRFKSFLSDQSKAFKDLVYQCQISTRYFDAGQEILQQGAKLDYLYIVPVGRVSMSILAANGRRFQLGEANCDYHVFGEMEFFTKTACQWNVIADEHLQVDVICLNLLTEALHKHPEMMFFFASALAEDYQDSLDIYTNRLLHPITYNIAYDLLVQKQTNTMLGGFGKVNQEAERFGTSGRVYRRAVKDLMDKGLIRKGEQGLEIVDEVALKAFLDAYE